MAAADVFRRVIHGPESSPAARETNGHMVRADVGGTSIVLPSPADLTAASRDVAITIPTVQRARDVLCSLVAVLTLGYWREADPADPGGEPERLANPRWFRRPDPAQTRAHIMAWTADDLIFYGRAFWRIRRRYADTGLPSAFQRIPFTEAGFDYEADGRTVKAVRWDVQRMVIPANDVLDFRSIQQGVCSTSARPINISLKLDESAERFAGCEIPAGTLRPDPAFPRQEPLTPADLDKASADFTAKRKLNITPALQGWLYDSVVWDADGMQLTESRQHQALEASRFMNVPPWIVGAPTGSTMVYQNAAQARLDLVDFGGLPLLTTIEQVLSGPNVVPERNYVEFDVDRWLRNPLLQTPGQGQGQPAPGGAQ